MKILLVCHSFPPKTYAGVEVHVHHLASMLGKKHSVKVVHRISDPDAEDGSFSYGEHLGVPTVKIVNNLSSNGSGELDLSPVVRTAFSRILETEKPDIVHFHHLIFLSADLVDEVAGRQIPAVATIHDFWYMCLRVQLYIPGRGRCRYPGALRCFLCFGNGSPLLRLIKRLPFNEAALTLILKKWRNSRVAKVARRIERMRKTLNRFDHIFANSNHLRNRYIAFGAPAEKTTVMRYGLDTAGLRRCRHPVPDKVRFGYMGTIIEHKGVHRLLEVFRRVPEASLTIWGETDLDETTRLYRSSMDPPDNVRFMGGYSFNDIGRVLTQVDVLIVPSLWEEAYSLVLDEAKLAGIPVIASRIGGIPEHLRHGKEGYLVVPGSVSELEKWVRRLWNRPDLVENLRPSGEDVATLVENAQGVEALYRRLSRKPMAD